MDKLTTVFKIIRLLPDVVTYYPASITVPAILQRDSLIAHTALEIPLGHSRYGGPVVDLPVGVHYPEGLHFAAQLDLAAIAPFDELGLLPKTGQLIFFADIRSNTGQVLYADVPNTSLTRVVKEHESDFWEGQLIRGFRRETETLAERFDPLLIEEAGGTGWDYFTGSEKSKVYGIYTHCQLEQEEIEAITFSSQVLLLQIGEDFTEEGVFSVLISHEDLQQQNFARCRFAWGQS
jgi:hypothetical protein